MENAVIGPESRSPSGPNSKDAFSADPEMILQYIAKVLRILLGAEQEDLENFGSLLSEGLRPHTLQLCSRFALENHPAIYVMKELLTSTVLDGVIDLSRRRKTMLLT